MSSETIADTLKKNYKRFNFMLRIRLIVSMHELQQLIQRVYHRSM